MTVKKMAKAAALDTSKWKKFLVDLLILLVSTIVTFTAQNLALLDFGQYNAILIPILALVLKYFQQFLDKLKTPTPNPVPVPNDEPIVINKN